MAGRYWMVNKIGEQILAMPPTALAYRELQARATTTWPDFKQLLREGQERQERFVALFRRQ